MTTQLSLPPLLPSPYRRKTRDELIAMIVTLEVANYRAEVKADLLAEELRSARARQRHLARKLMEVTA